MKKIFFALLLFVGLQTISFSQNPSPTPPKSDDDVVVISTNLIQVDAVVVDKNGKQVTDLKPEDFEILENGVKQQITNFSYIAVAPTVAEAENNAKPKSNPADKLLPPAPTRIKPEQVRRTIALVVDDLGLSFESTARVRDALKRFVDEQMQPNDVVAIIRTAGGIGALQQFTTDKRQLYAAIERVRWYPTGRGGIGTFAPIEATPLEAIAKQTGSEEDTQRAADERRISNDFDNFRSDIFSVGTLGALNFVVKGMSELPGRKAVVLFSDGFKLFTRTDEGEIDPGGRILDSLRRLTEAANRASVVINTIDPRGLAITGMTAADDVSGLTFEQLQQRLTSRSNELFDTQEGLMSLAEQTGGRAFVNNNDIKGSVEKVLNDQKGYYLIGYQPDDEIFEPGKRRFNKLTIRVLRPGLKVRYRSGFFGVADKEEAAAPKQTPQQQIMYALTSPFGANGVNLRLNAIFGNDPKAGSFIRSLLHINAKDLKFVEQSDGTKKAVFDVVAYTFGDNGVPVDTVNKSYTLTVKKDAESYRDILEKGFVYTINVPIKKPGAYQLRVALRDSQAERIGSANQFVEVPNLKKDRLALSGIILQNMTRAQYERMAKEQTPAALSQINEELDAQTDTALRRFRRGTVLQYAYAIFNAKPGAGNRPQLTTQMRLFRNGKLIFEGKPEPLDTTGQTDMQRIGFSRALLLPDKMQPGDYVLQVVATDALAKEKRRVATQWVEFELID